MGFWGARAGFRAGVLAVAASFAWLMAPAGASAEPRQAIGGPQNASLMPDEPQDGVILPAVLSQGDIDLYVQIFEVQELGDWKAADRLIAKLEDRLLMGHVLSQRYLHPTKYRSHYKELAAWLAEYADHPGAARIYKLALARKPKNAAPPNPPAAERSPPSPALSSDYISAVSRKDLTAGQRREVVAHKVRIRRLLKQGNAAAVRALLVSAEVQRLFSAVEYDQARALLGQGYFNAGQDELALQWAGAAANRSSAKVPEAHWLAGLAAWRLARFEVAARHFEAAAKEPGVSPWAVSAAAFWAARTHLVNRNPDKVHRWLEVAAAHPRTFYGILAGRLLGQSLSFKWASPPIESAEIAKLADAKAGRRAVALIEVGDTRRAEQELKTLAVASEPRTARGILALAANADMPALAVRLDRLLFPNGGGYDGAAFPIPSWEPEGGFRVDRALVYALIRQESAFNPRAKSWAGASGLMQIMPKTASYVAGDRAYRDAKRRKLFAPEINLTLGQKYLEILINDPNIQGDLFSVVAAWNGGPGNLNKWWNRTNHLNDPLLFIESIPVRETRVFVERVLTNLWIYRNRLGLPIPSLDAIASGEWPVYTPPEGTPMTVADDGTRARQK
jgi:soluble lytic murein transglycosylase-like protein